MTLAQLFKKLGAPLHNTRWSWGAVRNDGIVFLRVWQDENIQHENHRYMRITKHAVFENDLHNPGYLERLRHIDAIRAGAHSYMVMCIADAEKLPKREILSFNKDEVFEGGNLIEINGDSWLELKQRILAKNQCIPTAQGAVT